MSKPPNQRVVEKYLKLSPGEFDHIPHYARESALEAIENVRRRELDGVFRPGVYYVVLSDLSRSSAVAAQIGQDLNKKRIETFILSCIESLGAIEPTNYFMPVREIGDAVLIIFSAFVDVIEWWNQTNMIVDKRNELWDSRLKPAESKLFRIQAKTIIHLGEVAYSDQNIPISQAVNEVFKVEKLFKPDELGITEIARVSAAPVLRELGLTPRFRSKVFMPGVRQKTSVHVVAKYRG